MTLNQVQYQNKEAWFSQKAKPSFFVKIVAIFALTLSALLCVLTFAYFLLVKPVSYPQENYLYKVEHRLVSNNLHIDGDMLFIQKLKPRKNDALNSICAPCLPLLW